MCTGPELLATMGDANVPCRRVFDKVEIFVESALLLQNVDSAILKDVRYDDGN